MKALGKRRKKSESKRCLQHVVFQAVTHLSTNHARRCLTSVIGREPVFSTWYGSRYLTAFCNLYKVNLIICLVFAIKNKSFSMYLILIALYLCTVFDQVSSRLEYNKLYSFLLRKSFISSFTLYFLTCFSAF